MFTRLIIASAFLLQFLVAFSQERLELLETNVSQSEINNYADSYLWTKNWWLTNGMIVQWDDCSNK
jgi:hypothetical protein